jgi:hypothetical protein
MSDTYIKYYDNSASDTDNGTRPIPNCGAGPNYPWMSSSIGFVDTAGNPLPSYLPRLGQPCRIFVRVDSKETVYPPQPPRVKVQIWVCDFTLGVGPASVRQYTGGSFDQAGMTSSVQTQIAAGTPAYAYFPWTPAPGDMRNVNPDGQAHMCIGANVFRDGEPAPEGPMPPPDVIDICKNQHHGQRNITILPIMDAGDAQVDVHNFKREPTTYTVRVRDARGRLSLAEREQLYAQPFVKLEGGRAVDLRAARRAWRAAGELGEIQTPLVPTAHLALAGGGQLVIARKGVPLTVSQKKLGALWIKNGGSESSDGGIHVRTPAPRAKQRPQMATVHAAFAKGEPVGAVKRIVVEQCDPGGTVVGGALVVFVKTK